MKQTLRDRPLADAERDAILGEVIIEIAQVETVVDIVDVVLSEISHREVCTDIDAMREEIVERAMDRLGLGAEGTGMLPRPRSIGTVDIRTVHAALTASGRLAAREARQNGLTPAGRR